MHLLRYEREGETFLRRIITTDETWANLLHSPILGTCPTHLNSLDLINLALLGKL